MDWRCSCASVKEMYMYWLISDILHRPDAHLSDIDHCSSGHAPTATVPVAFHIIASSAPSVRLFSSATHCRPSARIALLPSPACTTIVCAQKPQVQTLSSLFPKKGNAGQEAKLQRSRSCRRARRRARRSPRGPARAGCRAAPSNPSRTTAHRPLCADAIRGRPSIAAERRSWRGRCAHGSDQLGVSHVPQAGFSSAIAHVLLLSRWLDTEPFAAPFDQRGNCTTSTWFQTAAFPNEFSRRNHSMRTVYI